ncbi:hybrid sensor histidine kinase/response regulator [Laspinema olomoucense]|uniref:histidine kinase n=1 Tax=Laspinema olomoucense D3b TaxID=2953688 RepID=A0ABT2N2X0_9CYAN|nr:MULTISPECIES: ATP-binding protein [unclassified Laspinema]MCT7974764.1 ATP-binding protein [Laspinema sp. D3d]MCT7976801.1 ATP-binding protein [Laspinema sp. D3b]MCT7990362.1 ATP-binding protein [Laspinema sp. D3a]
MKILLVEDNRADAELLQEVLSDFGEDKFTFAHVWRISEALKQLAKTEFDVVLLDLSLPDSWGLETLMQVQNQAPTIPVVVLTGSQDEEQAIEAVRKGAQDYLLKGQLVGALLVRAIHHAIERNRTLEALRRSEERFQTLAAELDLQVQERTRQLQRALEKEAMLNRITEKLRDSLDERQILQTAVRELALALESDYCNAALYQTSPQVGTVCYEYTHNKLSDLGEAIRQVPEIYGRLLHQDCVQFCPIFLNEFPQGMTILVTPIFGESGAIGNLCLCKPAHEKFSLTEIGLVQQVASQCAIAVRQARLYQASLAQVQELERLNRLKDDFLSTVSHELRTPIANIKMAVQILEMVEQKRQQESSSVTTSSEGRGSKPPHSLDRAEGYFKILREECDREIRLIDSILELQRLEAAIEPVSFTPVLIQQWVGNVVAPFIQKVQKTQQILDVDIDPALPPVLCDSDILQRILTELLENACKYTPAQGTIKIRAHCDRSRFHLQVSNSSLEIPPSELTHVFDKFYRVPSSDPWKHGGTGLGLALVRKQTEYIGGQIKVTSAFGETCFTLELPLSPLHSLTEGCESVNTGS